MVASFSGPVACYCDGCPVLPRMHLLHVQVLPRHDPQKWLATAAPSLGLDSDGRWTNQLDSSCHDLEKNVREGNSRRCILQLPSSFLTFSFFLQSLHARWSSKTTTRRCPVAQAARKTTSPDPRRGGQTQVRKRMAWILKAPREILPELTTAQMTNSC